MNRRSEMRTVVLRNERDENGGRLLEATYNGHGDLVIQGRDWGTEVARFWGGTEYEWAWTIRAAEIPTLLAALDLKEDPILGLKSRFSDENAADLGDFLDEHAIAVERWSRVGD